MKSKEEEKSLQKSQKNKDQSSRGIFQRTKELMRNKDNEVSNMASSCTRTKMTELIREKKSTRYKSEKPRIELKMAEKFTNRDLDERLIAEVAK